MSASSSETLVDWNEEAVQEWISSLGFPQYKDFFVEHGISGDILSALDHETLKEVGVHSVGQRLTILKEVYHLKVQHGVTIEPEHYVPPSEAIESASQEGLSADRLFDMIGELRERMNLLEDENRKLSEGLHICLEELTSNRSANRPSGPGPENSLRKQPSFKWANYDQSALSPTRLVAESHDSPRPSPSLLEHDVPHALPSHLKGQKPATPSTDSQLTARPTIDRTQPAPTVPQAASVSALNRPSPSEPESRPSASSSTAAGGAENQFKSFKVSLDDPCWKVLPAALKKYKISDDWRQYVMFICYGSTERCLSYDEKPLLLFQKLKDANKNPVFMLRNIRDIRSPIALAQQKQTQRLRESSPTAASSSRVNSSPSQAPGSATTPPSAPAYSRNTRLHHAPVLQPISAQAQAYKAAGASSTSTEWPETAAADASHSGDGSAGRTLKSHASDEPAAHPDVKDGLAAAGANGQVSYAIAIYPYMAEQDDEFDVVVDDTYIILSRTKGWWIVQHDVDGTGIVDDSTKGWVPAGCLLETNVPPASAVSEAKSVSSISASSSRPANGNGTPSPDGPSLAHKAPILPTSIISTSFPGLALMNYMGKADYELDLARGDVLRVFKRYNHWSYAIKEDNGGRGWVPSWFVGKYVPGAGIQSGGIVPPTPTAFGLSTTPVSGGAASSHAGDTSDGTLLDVTSSDRSFTINGSPLSPGFPPSSTTTATPTKPVVPPI